MIFIRNRPSDIQILPFQMNQKQKVVSCSKYTPPSQCRSCFITELTKVLDKCRSNFENIVVLGDFNMEPTNEIMITFMADNDFIFKSNTCFKTSTGTCIDLILTKKTKKFS